MIGQTDRAAWLLVDDVRSRCLCDVGGASLLAATAIDGDGREYLVVAEVDQLGDPVAVVDVACPDAPHEQLGPLPLEYVRRFTVAQRTHRCGRPTAAGRPCRALVGHHGAACAHHRTGAAL